MTVENDERHLVVIEVERKDEEQIIEYLSGGVVDEYVYSFRDGKGRMQVGMSWAGTRELAQAIGNIRINQQPIIEEHEDHWRGMVLAEDLSRNVALWGGTHQPKKMMVHVYDHGEDTGEIEYVPDPFAYEKCLSKSQRNALKAVMPVTVVTKFVIQYCVANDLPMSDKLKKIQKSLDMSQTWPAIAGEVKNKPGVEKQKDDLTLPVFWGDCYSKLGLPSKQVLERLKIKAITEYPGTRKEAFEELQLQLAGEYKPPEAQDQPAQPETTVRPDPMKAVERGAQAFLDKKAQASPPAVVLDSAPDTSNPLKVWGEACSLLKELGDIVPDDMLSDYCKKALGLEATRADFKYKTPPQKFGATHIAQLHKWLVWQKEAAIRTGVLGKQQPLSAE